MKTLSLYCLLFLAFISGVAQENLTYQQPPKEILDLVDAPLAPSVRIDNEGKFLVMLFRNNYKTLGELSENEMRLAGLRINPKTNIGSRVRFFNNMKIINHHYLLFNYH